MFFSTLLSSSSGWSKKAGKAERNRSYNVSSLSFCICISLHCFEILRLEDKNIMPLVTYDATAKIYFWLWLEIYFLEVVRTSLRHELVTFQTTYLNNSVMSVSMYRRAEPDMMVPQISVLSPFTMWENCLHLFFMVWYIFIHFCSQFRWVDYERWFW